MAQHGARVIGTILSIATTFATGVPGGFDLASAAGHIDPGVCCLEPAKRGFIATSCGPLLERGRGLQFPRLAYEGSGEWRTLEPTTTPICPVRDQPAPGTPQTAPFYCEREIRLPELTLSEAQRLRPTIRDEIDPAYPQIEQRPGLCVRHGGYWWFGISFYNSEHASGVGGIGRFDPKTRHVEIRRPALLRDASAYALVHDGRWLWLGTAREREGWSEDAYGLLRYDWERDSLERETGGPCGGIVHGAALVNSDLWVASNAGLSRRKKTGRWDHFLVRFDRPEHPLVSVTCERLRRMPSRNPYEK